jgi:hypothetical protein
MVGSASGTEGLTLLGARRIKGLTTFLAYYRVVAIVMR